MNAMQSYKVIVRESASADLDSIAMYIANIYRPESGHKFVNKVLGQLASLSFTAGIYNIATMPRQKALTPMRRHYL